MFTGIIEEVGIVEAVQTAQGGTRLRFRARTVMDGLKQGDSVAVSGVCLTAVEVRPEGFSADISPETLRRSTLRELTPGAPVNLERALTPSTRMGGHIVQGHVDGVGEIVDLQRVSGESWWLSVRADPRLDRYFAEKGSVAVDGISLTIAAIEDACFSVAVIPHTIEQTTLKQRRPGDHVNIETDVLAKYVEKLLLSSRFKPERLTAERLREMGW